MIILCLILEYAEERKRTRLSVNTLGPGEPVHLQHPDLEVPAGAEGRIVEGLAHVRFAESNVFVHPYRLPPSGNTHTNYNLQHTIYLHTYVQLILGHRKLNLYTVSVQNWLFARGKNYF